MSADSDYSDAADDGGTSDTDFSDAETDIEDDFEDGPRLRSQGAQSQEYYLDQIKNFNEHEYTVQDYAPSSTQQLNYIENQWYRSASVPCALTRY